MKYEFSLRIMYHALASMFVNNFDYYGFVILRECGQPCFFSLYAESMSLEQIETICAQLII